MTPAEFERRRKGFVKYLPRTVLGRDFFTGDIHGSFGLLDCGLSMVDFDESKDRLIAVGDLVDRGHQSDRCLEFMAKPWFHSVQGNHEDMGISYAITGKVPHMSVTDYITHGGAWMVSMMPSERQDYAYAMMELPYLIQVETSLGPIGVVHADTLGDSWDFTVQKFKEVANEADLERLKGHCLWSRNRYNQLDTTAVCGVHAAMVGHTPLSQPYVLGNTYFIDTGAVFRGGTLCLIEVSDLKDIKPLTR
jgi:serine/threonine protein phosphatase 1